MDKTTIRRDVLKARKTLGAVTRASATARILEAVRSLPDWTSAREVLAFMPLPGEADITPLIRELLDRGVRLILPRCRPDAPGQLDLACLSGLDSLRPGAYGILEPDPDVCPALDGVTPDLALIPGVAFDRRGTRLGFGQGYYDRLLTSPGLSATLLVAPAFGLQLLDTLPADPWDRPVQVICTELETIWTNR